MNERRRRVRSLLGRWGPVAGYILLIFYASSISTVPSVPPLPHLDKLVHLGEYGLLGLLLGRALGLTGLRHAYWKMFGISLAIGACVGVADELYQGTVAGRERSPYDFAADLAGLSAALLLLRAWALRGGRSRSQAGRKIHRLG